MDKYCDKERAFIKKKISEVNKSVNIERDTTH